MSENWARDGAGTGIVGLAAVHGAMSPFAMSAPPTHWFASVRGYVGPLRRIVGLDAIGILMCGADESAARLETLPRSDEENPRG